MSLMPLRSCRGAVLAASAGLGGDGGGGRGMMLGKCPAACCLYSRVDARRVCKLHVPEAFAKARDFVADDAHIVNAPKARKGRAYHLLICPLCACVHVSACVHVRACTYACGPSPHANALATHPVLPSLLTHSTAFPTTHSNPRNPQPKTSTLHATPCTESHQRR
jgi:hypothetical protein